jgi:hypothetical protein
MIRSARCTLQPDLNMFKSMFTTGVLASHFGFLYEFITYRLYVLLISGYGPITSI